MKTIMKQIAEAADKEQDTSGFRTHKTLDWAPEASPVKRHVVCAAVKFTSGLVITGARHWDDVMRDVVYHMAGDWTEFRTKHIEESQGFIDQYGDYMTREEAAFVVNSNKQPHRSEVVPHTLFSEDLY
jgi:hypothetical protein